MSNNDAAKVNPSLTPEVLKTKFSIALNKAQVGIQVLHNIESGLVYNEDNIVKIKSFLDTVRSAKKVVADEHQAIKAPALKECQLIDSSKREMDAEIDGIYNKAQKQYEKLCLEVENKRKAAEREKQRIQSIQEGIDANTLMFTEKITKCVSSKELVEIEKLIHIEKTRTNKYQEFLPVAIERFDALAALVSTQKKKVKELEELEKRKKSLKSVNDGDEVSLLDLNEQIEEKRASIEEGFINIQEVALNEATTAIDVSVAEEILPITKARRTTWEVEVLDIKEVQKKMPHLVKLVVDEEKLNDLLQTKKTDGSLKNVEELKLNGLRFFIKKTY